MKHNFLFTSDIGEKLYLEYAKDLPIIDYHNHLSMSDIVENKRFFDIYELWIKPDPYKHRAMRMCGVEEKYITGDGADIEKFAAWCETIPKLLGNPLYTWSLMELETIFGITEIPDRENAQVLYHRCNEYLKEHEISVNVLFENFKVEYACPCTSLIDNIAMLEKNEQLAPSLRGDDIANLSVAFVERLEGITNIRINDLEDLKNTIRVRLDAFRVCGCRFSDHALDNGFRFYADDGKNPERFQQLMRGGLDKADSEKLTSHMLVFLGEEYAKRNFVMQLHIGAERYTSTRLRNLAGAAGGFAGIGNSVEIASLTKFLDTLDSAKYGLPKTILFTLNPADNAMMSALSGSYSKDNVSGLITQGPAWWWCDHRLGICDMLENTAAFGVLSNFIGMTTDSRSLLSFVRHDYFRCILCEWLGTKTEKGELVCDFEILKRLAYKMCYGNAKGALTDL